MVQDDGTGSWYKMMVQDHGTGSWWWRNIIAREHHCPIVDHHPGPRGGEGEGGSRRAGEQLHPAPTWEHGGWRMEDHGMEDGCVSTRWPITMACRDGILLSHYWNGILLQYYCHMSYFEVIEGSGLQSAMESYLCYIPCLTLVFATTFSWQDRAGF